MPDVKRGFKVPFYPYTPVFAMISCIVLAFYLNINAVMTACIFLAVGIAVYYLNKKKAPYRTNRDIWLWSYQRL